MDYSQSLGYVKSCSREEVIGIWGKNQVSHCENYNMCPAQHWALTPRVFSTTTYKAIVGVQNESPQDVPLWHVNYFELQATDNLKVQEKLLPTPL